jgi:hypothetical protein
VRTLDANSGDSWSTRRVPLRRGRLELDLPEQSVTWVRMRCQPDRSAALRGWLRALLMWLFGYNFD